MALATVQTRASLGMHAPCVMVETHIANGLPQLTIVGLPETEVKESRDRVRSALANAHFQFPVKRITVNLAPADLPKQGSRFDLAIALSILAASGQIPLDSLKGYEFLGELSLSGALRAIHGILPSALATKKAHRALILPTENADEASLTEYSIFAADTLLEVCAHLTNQTKLTAYSKKREIVYIPPKVDLAEVHGQAHAKRALEIAAAGQHNMLLIGPPGTGKTMLANCLSGILPLLSEEKALPVAALQSMSHQGFQIQKWRHRPFRAPHHTSSYVALVGGGRSPRAGEISLAHEGILFLDELPEFKRSVLEALREPLESGSITISRALVQMEFPANFQLIAAMNPCPCGYLGSSHKMCECTQHQIQRYRARLSGPLLDRIDMHIEVPDLSKGAFSRQQPSENSKTVQARIEAVQTKQKERQQLLNSQIPGKALFQLCDLQQREKDLLDQAMMQLGLSARTYHRILRVARTIADLESSESVKAKHITEALSYRRLERQG